jgi:hypothetical protein
MWKSHADEPFGLRQISFHENRVLYVYNAMFTIYNIVIVYLHIIYINKVTIYNYSNVYNSNKSPTRCNHFPVYYPELCLQLNMFRAFYRSSSGAQWLQWQPLVLHSFRGDSRAVFVVGPAGRLARPRTQHDCHHDTKAKPEAATAVIELLMMSGKTPETCWAVNKRQDNKL